MLPDIQEPGVLRSSALGTAQNMRVVSTARYQQVPTSGSAEQPPRVDRNSDYQQVPSTWPDHDCLLLGVVMSTAGSRRRPVPSATVSLIFRVLPVGEK